MRKDRQHNEYRPLLLGLHVYYGASEEGSAYWRDMLMAMALVMRDHDPKLKRQKIGAATGAVHLTRLALMWLPEPWKTEVQNKYLMLREKRAAIDAIDAANAEVTE